MKTELKTIKALSNSPFRILHDPKLSDVFYWHFHSEYELVYIEGASATRHVGDHISEYQENDLVLIGSNIPHLNLDYGIQTNYRQEVLHIKSSFKKDFVDPMPELKSLNRLLEMSRYGIAFYGDTKKNVGEAIKNLHTLAPFEYFMAIMNILKQLSQSSDFELLHTKPYKNSYSKKEQKRIRSIYALVAERYKGKIGVDEVAAFCNLTKPAFCRYFKKATGNTFIAFLNQYRISQAKRLLLSGNNISESCFECGFESLSYFNRTFKKVTGENPSAFKKRMFKQNVQKTT